jgi:hypothetical protein
MYMFCMCAYDWYLPTIWLLYRHRVQLQRSRPHQPLPLAQMWPRQRLLSQVPQALHEGRVTLVEAWAKCGTIEV